MSVKSRWPIVPLGDVVNETQYGTSLKANDEGAGVPVLRMNNITYSGVLDLTDIKHVELPAENLERYSVRHGDLLFNRTNSQDLVGKLGVWNRDEQFAFAGYLIRLRLKRSLADPTFVAAWFNTTEMKKLLRARAKPSINMSNINATEVLKFPVVLPPLAEQRRIAEMLDRAEALRAKRRAALGQLDSLTQSIFLDFFGDPVANPKGFPKRKVSEAVSRLTNGFVGPTRDIYHETGVPYLLARHVKANRLKFDGKTFVSEAFNRKHSKSILKAGDVLLVQSGHVGESAVVPPEHVGHNCHAMIVITPRPELLSGHFLSQLFSTAAMRRAFGGIETGITLAHLNVVMFAS